MLLRPPVTLKLVVKAARLATGLPEMMTSQSSSKRFSGVELTFEQV